MIIISKNQTAGALALDQLPVPNNEIPASGQVTLTDFASLSEIQQDEQLLDHITAGDVILNVAGVDLSAADSEAFVGTVANIVFTASAAGLTPASGGGTALFLRADGTWATPPGGTGGGVVICCPFGAKSDSQGKFLIANGKSSDGDDSSKPKTRQPIPVTGKIIGLAYKTKEGEATTRMKLHISGSIEASFLLANIDADFGGVEVLDVDVTAGQYSEIEWDGPWSKKPGECTMCLILEPS
jgi:hypothetical protein